MKVICLNCNKPIPDNKWCCNEECVREYYKRIRKLRVKNER